MPSPYILIPNPFLQVRASESNLFQLLARVAPPAVGQPPEVMIAISNFNLIAGGQLNAWLDVRPRKQQDLRVSGWSDPKP